MIVRLLLLRSPHAARILDRIPALGRTADEKALLRLAMEVGLEAELSHMERETGFVHEIGNCALADVPGEARRVTTLLRAIEEEGIRRRSAEIWGGAAGAAAIAGGLLLLWPQSPVQPTWSLGGSAGMLGVAGGF